MANKLPAIIPSGTNQYYTPSLSWNRVATDNITPGVVGAIGNAAGVGPATGGFGVSAQGSPNMTVAVNLGQAYVSATPTGGTAQTFGITSDASENVTIAANSTGSTRYDFVYIKLDADKLNNPASTGLDVITLITQRSTTQYVDSNGAPANSLLLAEVTVANAASSIANASIVDRRVGTGFNSTGWANPPISGTWTYASADAPTFVITTPTDTTGWASPGMRIRLRQSGAWLYFIVTAVTATTLTVYGGTDYVLANAAISQPQFSVYKAPFGFPLAQEKWSVELLDSTIRVTSAPVNGTVYNPGSLSISIPIGAWRVYYEAPFDPSSSSGTGEACWGISTANNSFSSNALREYAVQTSPSRTCRVIHMEAPITVTVKTPYYVVVGTLSGTWSDVTLRNNSATLRVRAVSAYL